MSVEQYNADWDKHQSPEGNGIDDPSVINETSRDSHLTQFPKNQDLPDSYGRVIRYYGLKAWVKTG